MSEELDKGILRGKVVGKVELSQEKIEKSNKLLMELIENSKKAMEKHRANCSISSGGENNKRI